MRRPVQLVVSLTVFVDLLGFTVILPSLPFFAADLGATGLWYGLTVSAYSIAQFLAAPLLGRLSDRYGRRPVLLLALAGSALSLALTGAAGSLAWLIAARALAGGFGGSISVAQAYLADGVPEERRTGAMAILGMAIGAAFVVGPALGAVLAPWGFPAAAYAAAGLAAANLVAAFFLLPEPERVRRAAPGRAGSPGAAVLLLSGTGFLTMAAFVGMETTLAFLGRDRYGWGPEAIGLAMAAAGLSMAAVQAGPVMLLARRWGDARVAAAGAVVMAVCLPVVPAGPAWLCLLAVCVLAAGNGLVTPTVASLLAAGPPERRGVRLGAGQSASAFARIAGPAGAGVLFDAGVMLPYVAGAGLAGLAAITVLAARTRSTQPESGNFRVG